MWPFILPKCCTQLAFAAKGWYSNTCPLAVPAKLKYFYKKRYISNAIFLDYKKSVTQIFWKCFDISEPVIYVIDHADKWQLACFRNLDRDILFCRENLSSKFAVFTPAN